MTQDSHQTEAREPEEFTTEQASEQEELAEQAAQEPEVEQREPQPVTILDTELERLQEELREAREKYQLLLAESENRRKRMQRERTELTKHAIERVLVEFLQPVDQFEQALGFADQANDEVKNWAIGFQMILGQIRDVFAQHGVVGFECTEGDRFDPHHHEAVDTEETDEIEAGTILKQFARGYKVGERTIRPAQVKVAKAPRKEVTEETKTKEKEDVQEEEQ